MIYTFVNDVNGTYCIISGSVEVLKRVKRSGSYNVKLAKFVFGRPTTESEKT